jgi:hypothetical protein
MVFGNAPTNERHCATDIFNGFNLGFVPFALYTHTNSLPYKSMALDKQQSLEQVFDVIAEYLCFLIQSIDRLVFKTLSNEQRQQLIHKLANQSAFY